MNEWENLELPKEENAMIDFIPSKQNDDNEWKNIDISSKEALEKLKDFGKDKKVYNDADELWKFGETKDKKPIYKTKDEMDAIDRARANFAQTSFSEGVNKLFGLKGNEADVKVVDGKKESLDNKIINDMDNQQIQEYIGRKMIPSDNPKDKHLYAFESLDVDGTTSIKFGIAKKSFQDRYKKQPEVLQGARLLFDEPVENAEEIENTIHGSKWARENREFAFGKGHIKGSGGTEYYDAKSLLFGETTTNTAQTPIQENATKKVETILKDNPYKDVAKNVRDIGHDLNTTTENINSTEIVKPAEEPLDRTYFLKNDTSKLTVEQLIEKANKVREGTNYLTPGRAYSKDVLESMPQYQELARKIDGDIFKLEGDTPQEKAKSLSKQMSSFNWNMMDTVGSALMLDGNKKLAKNFSDALELYDATDTDATQVVEATKNVATDPTSWISLGTFPAIKGIAQEAGKKGLINYLRGEVPKNVAIGATEGAGYAGTFDLARQNIDIEADKKKEINAGELAQSMGLGTVLGGALGGTMTKLMKAPTKEEGVNAFNEFRNEANTVINNPESTPKQIEEATTHLEFIDNAERIMNSGKTQEENIAALNSILNDGQKKGFLELDTEARKESKPEGLTPEDYETIKNEDGTSQVKLKDDVAKQIEKAKQYKSEQELQIVKGEGAKKTRSEIEQSTFKVRNPLTEQEGVIEGQKYIEPLNDEMKIEYGYDDRGRMYAHEKSLLSHQGTKEDKASLEVVPWKPKIEKWKDIENEIARRMNFYDHDKTLQQRYGQTQASLKQERIKNNIASKDIANRNAFMIDQYRDLYKVTEHKGLRQDIKSSIKEIKENKIVDYKISDELKERVDKQYYDQLKIDETHSAERVRRDIEISQDFKRRTETRLEKNEFDAIDNPEADIVKKQDVDERTIKSIQSKIDDQVSSRLVKDNLNDVKQGMQLLGRNWSGKSSEVLGTKLKNKMKVVDEYRNRLNDMQDFNDAKITLQELRYREERRLQDKWKTGSKIEFKDMTELTKFQEEKIKEYADIGLNVKPSYEKNEFHQSTGAQNSEKARQFKLERESKERKSNSAAYDSLIGRISHFRETGKLPISKDNKYGKQGQVALTEKQIQAIDDKILSDKEIAGMQEIPNVTNAEKKTMIKDSKKNAIVKIREAQKKRLGLSKNDTKPRIVNFKDSISDVSNSYMQIMATVLSSANIGKHTKLGGKGFELNDIREAMGKDFEEMGIKQPEKNGEKIPWKNVTKPLVMKEGYGQQQKSRINELMESNGITKEHAEQIDKAYQNIMEKEMPELKMVREAIYAKLTDPDFNGHIKYKIGNFEVDFKMLKNETGMMKIKGTNKEVTIKTGSVDEASRALMPNIIHSIDGYIARKMQKQGFHSTHDSFVIPAGRTEEDAMKAYNEILKEINSGNLFENIMKQIGVDSKKFKQNTLTNEMIDESTAKMKIEHSKDIAEEATKREEDLSRTLTDSETMREYMASNNHRQTPTGRLIDRLVQEAMHSNMSIARESDDVFERQFALAMQSPHYDKTKQIEAPEGVNKALWNKTQEEIFNESRAKIEYNPFLQEKLMNNQMKDLFDFPTKQERKFFDENGKMIGEKTKSKTDILIKERRLGRKIYNDLPKRIKDYVSKDSKSYQELALKVRNENKSKIETQPETKTEEVIQPKVTEKIQPKVEEAIEQKQMPIEQQFETAIVLHANEVQPNKGLLQKIKDAWYDSEFVAYIERQLGNTERSKQFNKLHAIQQHASEMVARKHEALKKNWDNILPKDELKNITKHILHTDLEAITDASGNVMSVNEIAKFMKDNKRLLDFRHPVMGKLDTAMNQSAKAIGRPENQIGHFFDNADEIVKHFELKQSDAEIIDKMITIKAMKYDTQAFIDKYKNEQWFKDVIQTRKIDKQRSKELFEQNGQSYVKGWIAEITDNGKMLRSDDNPMAENGFEVVRNTQPSYEAGAIPISIEKNKVGKTIEGSKRPINNETMNKAFENQMKITGKNDMKVAGEIIRKELGRTNDASQILAGTTASVMNKDARRTVVDTILQTKKDFPKIFSDTEQPNMMKIPPNVQKRMPYELQGEIRYIDKAMYRQIVGGESPTWTNGEGNRALRVVGTMVRDLTKRFKQDVVLKNPSSYGNAEAMNVTLGLSVGIDPIKIAKYQKEALDEMANVKKLISEIAIAESLGKDTKTIQSQLNKSELYQMEKIGLTTNAIEGVAGSGGIVSDMLSEATRGNLDKITNEILLNQNSTLGKGTTKIFSAIDTSGRYMIAKGMINKGKSIEEAVLIANGLLGDMNQIAPALISTLDNNGIAPFLKWFTQITPMIMKQTKENPMKAFGVAAAVYMLGKASDTREDQFDDNNFAGVNSAPWNPIGTPIDFAADKIESVSDKTKAYKLAKKREEGTQKNRLDSMEMLMYNELAPYILPSIYKKPLEVFLGKEKDSEWTNKDSMKVLRKTVLPKRQQKNNEVDYRPFTQQVLDDNLK